MGKVRLQGAPFTDGVRASGVPECRGAVAEAVGTGVPSADRVDRSPNCLHFDFIPRGGRT
ncbi:hypothetical protein ACIQVK_15530 [Streptomyces sp. NPDC090493]|uniref:hypothetical protein n=1 Tax=Streptomyces sp. NPDC090493 TaxID=3365964 RepID=UPI003817C8B7